MDDSSAIKSTNINVVFITKEIEDKNVWVEPGLKALLLSVIKVIC